MTAAISDHSQHAKRSNSWQSFVCHARRFGSANKGVAAIEFAMVSLALSAGLLNTADVSIYFFDRVQVENATEMGAQVAWKRCDLQHIPATTMCAGLTQAVTAAVQSTSLGTAVTLVAGSPTEGYYCVNSSNALQYMSSVSTKPADCSAAGVPANHPADYIKVQATYTYAPLFPNLTVARLFTTPIARTTWMRLG